MTAIHADVDAAIEVVAINGEGGQQRGDPLSEEDHRWGADHHLIFDILLHI